MKFRMTGWRRWAVLLVAVLLSWFLYPVMRVGAFLLFHPSAAEHNILLTKDAIDDASGLHAVSHAGIVDLGPDRNATEKLLRDVLARGRAENLAVVPFGARHSMGKQALREGAIHVDTSGFNHLEMDGDLLRAQSGARWSQVIDFLAAGRARIHAGGDALLEEGRIAIYAAPKTTDTGAAGDIGVDVDIEQTRYDPQAAAVNCVRRRA